MLIAERIHVLSDKVGVLTNKCYAMAPALVSDLQSVSGDLRELWEAVSEIEPSREDVARVEKRLRAYAYTLSKLAHGTPSWRKRAWLIDNPSHNPRDDVRVQGGAQIELAQRLVEKWEALTEEVDKTFGDLQGEVEIVEKALANLPDRMRRFIEMRYFDGLSMDEVSAELNICRREAYYTRDEALLMLVPYLA